jgi:hypothetical protein
LDFLAFLADNHRAYGGLLIQPLNLCYAQFRDEASKRLEIIISPSSNQGQESVPALLG